MPGPCKWVSFLFANSTQYMKFVEMGSEFISANQ
jgi:hypothetical protein